MNEKRWILIKSEGTNGLFKLIQRLPFLPELNLLWKLFTKLKRIRPTSEINFKTFASHSESFSIKIFSLNFQHFSRLITLHSRP